MDELVNRFREWGFVFLAGSAGGYVIAGLHTLHVYVTMSQLRQSCSHVVSLGDIPDYLDFRFVHFYCQKFHKTFRKMSVERMKNLRTQCRRVACI